MSSDTGLLLRRFKALADPQRLRILALCRHGELSVTELTRVLGQSQPRVSQHLKQVCEAGLLERFRDGKRVYYRLPPSADAAERRLLGLISLDEERFAEDVKRLRALRGSGIAAADTGRTAASGGRADGSAVDRSLHRALIGVTVAAPLGDLLDIGCGRGRILKLLASRANRAVGVDIDSDARDIARAELLLAGLPNCSLRQGDMNHLPFADEEFDTIVLDDVLTDAERPARVLREARRLLKPSGRLLVLIDLENERAGHAQTRLAEWSALAGLRLARPRPVPRTNPAWLVSVATAPGRDTVAA